MEVATDSDTGEHWYHIVCALTDDLLSEAANGPPCTKCDYEVDKRAKNPCSVKYPNLCGANEPSLDEDLFSQPLLLREDEQSLYERFGIGCKGTQHVQSQGEGENVQESVDIAWGQGQPGEEPWGPGPAKEDSTSKTGGESTRRLWPTRTLVPKPTKTDRNYRILKMLQKLIPMIYQAVEIAMDKRNKLDLIFETQYGYGNQSLWENLTLGEPNASYRSTSHYIALQLLFYLLVKWLILQLLF